MAAGGRAISPEASERLVSYVGSRKLSERELEVLRLISKGKSNKEAGQRLFVTEHTIKMHVKSILQKLEASDRTQAVCDRIAAWSAYSLAPLIAIPSADENISR